MGIFDPPQEQLEEAYGQGVQDSRDASQMGQAMHDIGQVLVPPSLQDTEQQSYNQGWDDQNSGKVK